MKLKKGVNRLHVAMCLPAPGAHLGLIARIGTADLRREHRVSC